MTIHTRYASQTYTAEIRGALESGYRVLYRGSCTAGEEDAARNLVRKYFGERSARTLRRIDDKLEIDRLTGHFFARTRRHLPVTVWTFDHRA